MIKKKIKIFLIRLIRSIFANIENQWRDYIKKLKKSTINKILISSQKFTVLNNRHLIRVKISILN